MSDAVNEMLKQTERLSVDKQTESEEVEDDEIPDVFSLNRVPPKRVYTKRVRYKFVGRMKPMPYDLDDDTSTDEGESRG